MNKLYFKFTWSNLIEVSSQSYRFFFPNFHETLVITGFWGNGWIDRECVVQFTQNPMGM